jgi:hypothetical protein
LVVVFLIFLGLPGPNLEQGVPRPGAEADTVVADSKTADTVLVAT